MHLLLTSEAAFDDTQRRAVVAAARAKGLPLVATHVGDEERSRWQQAGCLWFGDLAAQTSMEAPQVIGWLEGREVQPL